MTRLPDWIKVKSFSHTHATMSLLRRHGRATVCEEARCPNRPACFAKPTATFMILGPRCTRNCGFCAVESGAPVAVDPDEPMQVASAAAELGLRYVVITSVTRDDLPDGGAAQFAAAIRRVREKLPDSKVEVLVPDFLGSEPSLNTVLDAGPDVLNHNVETVPRLYPQARPQADYKRSLELLQRACRNSGRISVKSGFMLGLGEEREEVIDLLRDLRNAGCDMVTIGQYLRPSRENIPVVQYVPPDEFERYGALCREMGFRSVASGPLVRSSMNAEEIFGNVRV